MLPLPARAGARARRRVDALSRVVAAAMRRIEEGALSPDGASTTSRASWASRARHLRRAMQAELGVSPSALARVAAAGAGAAAHRRHGAADDRGRVRERLPQRAPVQRRGEGALRAPAVDDAARARRRGARAGETLTRHAALPAAVRLAGDAGLPRARARSPASSWCATASTCAPRASARGAAGSRWRPMARPRGPARDDLGVAVGRADARWSRGCGALFDLDAQPAAIAAHLARDPRLAPHVRGAARAARRRRVRSASRPRRAPCWDSRSASRPRGRSRGGWPRRLGEPIATPHAGADARCSRRRPLVAARAADDARASLGIPARRAATLRLIARAIARGELALDAARRSGAARRTDRRAPRRRSVDRALPRDARARLARRVPGGRSGAAQGAGRHLGTGRRARWPSRWRPWRAYGATHLWTERRRKSAMSNADDAFSRSCRARSAR